MIKLIDGRGQLGNTLQAMIAEDKANPTSDVFIYHRWNVDDKSKETQGSCYDEFKRFVDENIATKIVFISTYSQIENYYNYYKQLSEAYLLSNNSLGKVVRLPTIIGKGICQKFKEGVEAFGNMELITLKDAARAVLDASKVDSLVRNIRINGTIAPAQFVKDLILFGMKKID